MIKRDRWIDWLQEVTNAVLLTFCVSKQLTDLLSNVKHCVIKLGSYSNLSAGCITITTTRIIGACTTWLSETMWQKFIHINVTGHWKVQNMTLLISMWCFSLWWKHYNDYSLMSYFLTKHYKCYFQCLIFLTKHYIYYFWCCIYVCKYT